MKSPYVQVRIQAHLEAANLNTDEIIGTLVSHMRGDLADVLPENPILKAAKKKGISHLVRKVKTKQRFIKLPNGKVKRVVDTEVQVYSAQAAVKTLLGVFGMRNLPPPQQKVSADFESAVDRLMQRAEAAGIRLTRQVAIEKLSPLFGKPKSVPLLSHHVEQRIEEDNRAGGVERSESRRVQPPINEETHGPSEIDEVCLERAEINKKIDYAGPLGGTAARFFRPTKPDAAAENRRFRGAFKQERFRV